MLKEFDSLFALEKAFPDDAACTVDMSFNQLLEKAACTKVKPIEPKRSVLEHIATIAKCLFKR